MDLINKTDLRKPIGVFNTLSWKIIAFSKIKAKLRMDRLIDDRYGEWNYGFQIRHYYCSNT